VVRPWFSFEWGDAWGLIFAAAASLGGFFRSEKFVILPLLVVNLARLEMHKSSSCRKIFNYQCKLRDSAAAKKDLNFSGAAAACELQIAFAANLNHANLKLIERLRAGGINSFAN